MPRICDIQSTISSDTNSPPVPVSAGTYQYVVNAGLPSGSPDIGIRAQTSLDNGATWADVPVDDALETLTNASSWTTAGQTATGVSPNLMKILTTDTVARRCAGRIRLPNGLVRIWVERATGQIASLAIDLDRITSL